MTKTEYNCIMFALDNVEEREKRLFEIKKGVIKNEKIQS